MEKEDIFSKLNIKDYNNQLENILEKKNFSEGTKNILLNILYKIETAYDDYNKVKVYTKTKKEILQETIDTIEKKCNEIEIVKPKLNEKTKLGDKKYIVEEENKKIITYPSEKMLFYALCHLQSQKFVIEEKKYIIKDAMQELLNEGFIIDKQEIIRDFDGWTWNISKLEIENLVYNIIYQDIKIIVGDKFLQDNIGAMNFIEKFEKQVQEECNNSELQENIINKIYQIAILEDVKNDANKNSQMVELKEQLEKENLLMEDKKEYLQKISTKKKLIGKEIRKIDEILNNNQLLRKEFIIENSKLEEKIFSLSEYVEILQNRRQNMLFQLDEYSEVMKPMNYIKQKNDLNEKINILQEVDKNSEYDEKIDKLIIELQKNILQVFQEKIKKIETKKEFIKYVYLMRYYKLLYIKDNKQIKDITELQKEIKKTEKFLVTKACKLKSINILCENIEQNYNLISKILSYKIIELETVGLEFKKENNNIVLTIYDDNVIEDSIICENDIDIKVKFNKKIKLFN